MMQFKEYAMTVRVELSLMGDPYRAKDSLERDTELRRQFNRALVAGWDAHTDPTDVASNFYDTYFSGDMKFFDTPAGGSDLDFEDYVEDVTCFLSSHVGGTQKMSDYLRSHPAAATALYYLARDEYYKSTPAAQVALDFYGDYLSNTQKKSKQASRQQATRTVFKPDTPEEVLTTRAARRQAWEEALVA
jgi:hypothetical protein